MRLDLLPNIVTLWYGWAMEKRRAYTRRDGFTLPVPCYTPPTTYLIRFKGAEVLSLETDLAYNLSSIGDALISVSRVTLTNALP